MKFCHCTLGGTKACINCQNNNIIYGENSFNPGVYDITKNIEKALGIKEWRGCTGIEKEDGSLDLYFADDGKVKSINVWL